MPKKKQAYSRMRAGDPRAYLVEGASFSGAYDIPIMAPSSREPDTLIPFSEAVAPSCEQYDATVHFYENDQKIERFWKNPKRYIDKLKRFSGVISPDFSLYRDMPVAEKIWNTYRNYALGYWLQQQGVDTIANVRLSGGKSAAYALAGAPHGCTIAIGAHGNIRWVENRDLFFVDVATIVNTLHPTSIVVYGVDAYGVFNYPQALGIPVHFIPSARYQKLKEGALV